MKDEDFVLLFSSAVVFPMLTSASPPPPPPLRASGLCLSRGQHWAEVSAHVLAFGIWKIMLGLGRTLAVAAGVDFGAQWVMWGYSAAKETEHYYDLTGSLTFGTLTLTALALNHGTGALPPLRAALAGGLVLSWAARLGSFLFSRISADGKDSRFDGVRDNPSRFFVYWTVQGVWIFSTLSPVLVLASVSRAAAASAPLSAIGVAGGVLALAGLAIEAAADSQKSAFKEEHPKEFVNTGLWKISRHPNYLGEIMFWTGVYGLCAPGIAAVSPLAAVATAFSPAFVAYLLINLSGIPLVERSANKKYGDDPEYKRYVETTPVLVPGWHWPSFNRL